MAGNAWALAGREVGASDDEDAVLALAVARDRDAFGTLYERHRLAVYRFLRARTANEDEALELTATTFERAFASIHRFRPAGGGFVAWLLRIARNAAIDAGRRRRQTVELDVALVDDLVDGRPEEAALARERLALLARGLATLPDVQRDALALRYGSGLTAREIGEVLGKGEAATQKLLSRALAALRERIDGRD